MATVYSSSFPGPVSTPGIVLPTLAANPGDARTLWYSTASASMMAGAGTIMLGATGPVTDKAIVRFSGTGGAVTQNSLLTVSDAGLLAGGIGLQLTATAANPGTATTIWYDSLHTNKPMLGASSLLTGPTSGYNNIVPRFDGNGGDKFKGSSVSIGDTGIMSFTTGIVFTATATNPGEGLNTIWFDSLAGNRLKFDTSSIALGPASSTDRAVARFSGTGGYTMLNSLLTVSDAGLLAGGIGLQLTATAANPGTAQTLWFDSLASNRPMAGAATMMIGGTTSTDHALARYHGAGGGSLQNSTVIVDDAGATSGITSFDCTGNMVTGSLRFTNDGSSQYIQSALSRVASAYSPISFSAYSSTTPKFTIGTSVIVPGTGMSLRASQAPVDASDVARLSDLPDNTTSPARTQLDGRWMPGGSGSPMPVDVPGILHYGRHGSIVYVGIRDGGETFTTASVGGNEYFSIAIPVGYRPIRNLGVTVWLESSSHLNPYMVYMDTAGFFGFFSASGDVMNSVTIITHPLTVWYMI